jgi:pantetheine-phosphate adenylyltransferase
LDIAYRAAKLASRLIIAVLDNPNKETAFSAEKRVNFIREAVSSNSNIEVDSFHGLLAEYAVQKKATAIIRGLRNPDDFTSEAKYAACNGVLSETLGSQNETIFIAAAPALSFISSSIIKEAAVHIYKNGLNDSFIADCVPQSVRLALKDKFS